ncbi:NAD(P)/FAD-dependent oxidoreductase [Pseudonocardia halophobica]|uniref:Cyclohexanone monooxygenase n=1 Tax=Pseudonocardia halophobica TaxID=29401 RepID=A0A9W6KYN0_9PSEU|nr:NAD(P)/FAD-dependent oxidoreductase [Pseudonocardia halophobica]GLL10517.1 cyclohexanone monooxygenase [Pseudonocardia halophobica]
MSTSGTARDAVVIGAGFAGMYALKRLRDDLALDVVVVEAGDDVGGTWYWNRYPGARCDAESIYYSYTFDPELDQEWTWSERYSAQPEILAYAQHVAARYDLRKDIRFGTTVTAATWDPASTTWTVHTSDGDVLACRYLVSAAGCLSAANLPDIAGLADFRGDVLHTGQWPHEPVDLIGRRVAVIGTGSSGIQVIPEIAKVAAHLTVLQRTPNFTVPARNRLHEPSDVADYKSRYPQIRSESWASPGGVAVAPPPGKAYDLTPEQREESMRERWAAGGSNFMWVFEDTMTDLEANAVAAEFVRDRIRETVRDPEVAERLCPTSHPIGSKRICTDTDYYETFNRENVTLVDVRTTPIRRITQDGVLVGDTEVPADVIVFATGYDAMTGPLSRIDVRGVDGLSLRDKWSSGARAYLGIAVAGFPNLFTLTGPGSPSVLANVIASIEQHVDWLVDYLRTLDEGGIAATEADQAAEEEWAKRVDALAHETVYPQADSWYLGANIEGKPRQFLPYCAGIPSFREICDSVAADGYRGFVHSPAR